MKQRPLRHSAAIALHHRTRGQSPAKRSNPPTRRRRPGTLQTGRHAMVVAANPLAAKAGLEVLRAGGSAADAAVAIQAVLGLVEPQSSGLGGGAFISYYDARSRASSPITVAKPLRPQPRPNFFWTRIKPLPFFSAVLSGRSTGVPGAIAALSLLQHEHGKLPWRKLFADGERLATDGFTVTPRLARMIVSRAPQASRPTQCAISASPTDRAWSRAMRCGIPPMRPRCGGSRTKARRHCCGPIAQDIVNRVHEGELPGLLSLEDLAGYQPIESEALCRDWEQYRVCTPPPPAGGIAVLETLAMLSHTDIAARSADDPIAWVELGEAQRLMYADRNRYLGDPMFTPVPVQGLLDEKYDADRANLIGHRIADTAPEAGTPPGARAFGPDHTPEPGGTTNLIVADSAGNVVCMTTTVESVFGSGRMVDGFFLNNQLTDFSFAPLDVDGQPAANAVVPASARARRCQP